MKNEYNTRNKLVTIKFNKDKDIKNALIELIKNNRLRFVDLYHQIDTKEGRIK
ncbi:hypothetical protein K6U70_10435 [Vibrio vulnificus]|uniref:hypothetical protein n=1 Tax=Vibrio vulnificus TaxID=672 RepID=UPI001EEBE5FE|nr:hypothetical protein [Vibrio vulnificus]MCG6272546.1 hypothetical protein [Vibrio vulnificus]